MNPLYNRPKINFGQMRNQIMGFVKQQISMGVSPAQIKQQILMNNPTLQSMIQQQYGDMPYKEIARQNGYDVSIDLSQLGL